MDAYEPKMGESFYNFIQRVQRNLWVNTRKSVQVTFNDIRINVYRDSNEYDIATIYDLKCEIARMKAK